MFSCRVIERRAGKLREHSQRLDSILQSRRRLRGSDILYVRERLFRAGIDEATLLQRRADMERAGRSATLVVTLFEPGASPVVAQVRADPAGWWSRATRRAGSDLNELFMRATFGGAYLLYFAPLWIPGLVILWLLYIRLRRYLVRFREGALHLLRRFVELRESRRHQGLESSRSPTA